MFVTQGKLRCSGWAALLLVTAVFCSLLAPSTIQAQVDQGAITGVIQDPTGAVVANATVTLRNTDQGITVETKSSSTGDYTFSPVRIGNYEITVASPGFSTTTQKALTVAVGQQLQVNISLQVGATGTEVTVSTAPPQLQTDESSVGQVIDEHTTESLPLNGRNFTFLAQLSAGVNVAQNDTRGNAASGAFTANGLQSAQNNYLLDGIDNNSNAADFLNGTNFVILPPVDAISEFKVQTADFSAELGRSAGAVLNATIKSGTNKFHGAVWEFFRNDKFDAADWFEDNNGTKKGKLRQNQFGASIGGPILRNKLFFFGDYEGLRRVQGTVLTGTVPTLSERNSNFTNLGDLISGQSGAPRTDALGRTVPFGTILDPATTRATTAGTLDPVSGRAAIQTGFARDPINCSPTILDYTQGACPLNQLPAGRIDPNAVKLLNLYPVPTTAQFNSNYTNSPSLYEHRNAFDTRIDYNVNAANQIFGRVSFVDDPDFIPSIFSGIADGGGFQQGIQTARSEQGVLAYTHVFNGSMVNVARVGANHLHTTRTGSYGAVSGIPAQFGIQGVPQGNGNGGLPAIIIAGLNNIGSSDYLPSDEISQTYQVVDDFSKVVGRNSFKAGFEYQDVHFNTLQPPFGRGEVSYNTSYAGLPGSGNSDLTGRAQLLLTPTAATVPGGIGYVGGSNQVQASVIAKTYDKRSYYAGYFQDDIKFTPKLTVNVGMRYDFFGPIGETNGAQANFIQSGGPLNTPTFLIPASGKAPRTLSSTANNPSLNGNGFLDLLAKDGITLLSTDAYGQGVLKTSKNNFAPRLGFSYSPTSRLALRAGIGYFFNAFENAGYGPNIGRNYPFSYSYTFAGSTDSAPFSTGANPYGTCSTAGPGGSATIESGLTCASFTPLAVQGTGIGLQGLQFNFKTPDTISSNLSVQYGITRNMSATVAYVYTHAANLQVGPGDNRPSQLLPLNTNLTGNRALPVSATNPSYVPFRDFAVGGSYQVNQGSSIYNGLQTKLEQRLSNGAYFLLTYTWSKTLTDANDLLNGGSLGGNRAPYVPGGGLAFDWGPASFDIRNVIHFSGGYELPLGKGKRFMANSRLKDAVFGGYSLNYLVTLQGGQPITIACPSGVTTGTGCISMRVPGQDQKRGIQLKTVGSSLKPFFFGNPAAFQQPCLLGGSAANPVPIANSPAGCIPLTGLSSLGGKPGTVPGPGFHRLDFSLFKDFTFTERYRLQFRTEFFNILNHPNFSAPGFGGNGVVAIGNSLNFNSSAFGQIGSTRDAPYDPRQIQFALKLYY